MGATVGQYVRHDPRESLSFLEESLIECDEGTGDTVLLVGGPASGKTQVQHELVARARDLGVVTLTATGAADERDVDGGVLDQLLVGAGVPAALAERYGAGESDERITRLAGAIHRLACERAVLVAVDDLQHLDDTSTRLLVRLQRRARSVALLLVLSGTDDWYSGDGLLFSTEPHRRVQLTPLSAAAVAELVWGAGIDAGPERIHELSAGNPLLVSALLAAHRDSEDTEPAYSEALRQLLHRCGSPSREVATAIAVLDSEATPDLVATVASVDSADVAVSADVLAGTGLVTGVRFRYPPAATAVAGGLRGPEKTRLHARAAEVKHAQGLPAVDVAHHLLAAGVADAEWAMEVLVEAAEQAMLRDDVDFATRCLELADSICTAEWERQTVTQLLAKISWRVNPVAAAPHLKALREAGSLDQSDRVALARQALWAGERDTFETAFAALGHDIVALDPRTAAELTLAAHWHYGSSEAAPADDDPWLRTARTLAGLWRTGGSEATSASAERILRNCRLRDTSLEALATAVLALAYGGDVERAEGWCTSLREEAVHRGAVTWQAMLDAVGASLVLRRGDVSGAAERANAALALLGGPSWGVGICYPLATLLIAHTAAGAFKDAAAVLRYPLPDAALNTMGGLRYLRALGHFHLATDRGLAATSDFNRCARILREQELDLPAVVPWQADLAEANLRLGSPAVAADLANRQLASAAPTDAYARGTALRVLAFTTDAARRQGTLTRAAEAFRVSGDRLELARTMRVLQQHGRRAERSTGMVKPVRVPRRETPRPAPPRPTDPGTRPTPVPATPAATALSWAELRVAELAVLGRTNRQVAETLYITVSTVEQHLTRVYRKLGVCGRSALACELSTATREEGERVQEGDVPGATQ